MTEFQRSIRNDIVKVFLSSAWVALVAFGFQHYAAKRISAPGQAKVFPVSTASPVDPTILSRIVSENGLLEITLDRSPEPVGTAAFIDTAVKNLGINHIAVSALPKEHEGEKIKLELAKRGYRPSEINILFGLDPPHTEYAVKGVR